MEKSHNQLKLTDERTYFKPFRYGWCYDSWLKHEQSHWLMTEVPMAEDVKDWKNRLSQAEKYFLTNIYYIRCNFFTIIILKFRPIYNNYWLSFNFRNQF